MARWRYEIVLCSTGLERQLRHQVRDAVETDLVGWQYSGNFTSHVTHLVAVGQSSEKFRAARELGIPIVHPDWVFACQNTPEGGELPDEAAYRIDDAERRPEQGASQQVQPVLARNWDADADLYLIFGKHALYGNVLRSPPHLWPFD